MSADFSFDDIQVQIIMLKLGNKFVSTSRLQYLQLVNSTVLGMQVKM